MFAENSVRSYSKSNKRVCSPVFWETVVLDFEGNSYIKHPQQVANFVKTDLNSSVKFLFSTLNSLN